MTILEIILAVLLAISLILLIVVLVYFKYFRIYTRERFAFRVFLLIASLTASLAVLILSGGGAITQALNLFAKLIGFGAIDHQPTFSDKTLAVGLILALVYLAVKLHRNWPGEISTREHEAALLGLKPSVVRGAIAAIADIAGNVSLHTYSPTRRDLSILETLSSPTETKAWHYWVARILQISSNHMRIDELKDWFPDKKLYISAYGLKKMTVGIMCCEEAPPKDDVLQAITFVTEQSGAPIKFIVTVNSDNGVRSVEFYGDVEIEFRYRNELLDTLVDFSRYIEDINFRYETSEIAEGYPYKLPDVYVPSAGHIRLDTEREAVENVEEYVSLWSSERTPKHLAILGEYGQGKSVLALKVTHRLINSTGRMPILVTLGGRSPRTQTKLDILADWAAAYGINPKALLVLHEMGRLLLIFDGFDEMDLVGDAALRRDHFRTLWEFSRDRYSKILITGRPKFFLDQLEREVSLNVRPESIEVPYTVPIYLDPFDVPQISKALRAFDESVRGQIVGLVSAETAAASFRDLVSRPSTLFLAANIWGELKAIQNIRSAEVIGRFIGHSYERQQRKGLKSFLTSLEREYFTVGIALAAYGETGLSNHISKDIFQRAIIKLVDGFPDDLRKYDLITDQQRPALRERLQDRDMLIETVSTDVRSCGIIVTDLSQIDTFKFAHKSFFEYLFALNSVYRIFGWPLSKEKILHHAAKGGLGAEPSRFVFSVVLATTPLSLSGGMSREMNQFAGEILYRLLGANSHMPSSELEGRLSALGIRINRLRAFCGLWQKRRRVRHGLSSLGLKDIFMTGPVLALWLSSRVVEANVFMIAALFRIHGSGGDEFIKLDDELLEDRHAAIRLRADRASERSERDRSAFTSRNL